MNKKIIFITLFSIITYSLNAKFDLSQEPYKTIAQTGVDKYKKEVNQRIEKDCHDLAKKLRELIIALAVVNDTSIPEEYKKFYFSSSQLSNAKIQHNLDWGRLVFQYDQKEFENAFNTAINKTISEMTYLKCTNKVE